MSSQCLRFTWRQRGLETVEAETDIMKLFGPDGANTNSPADWISEIKRLGYEVGCVPLSPDCSDAELDAYLNAAKQSNIVIGEVGAWSNPIDPDSGKARAAIAHCKERLAWAERIGARCCVNIAGSRNLNQWDGPHPDNFSQATFDLIVETTREIIDAVNPTRTFYTLETMPWIFPSSPDEYLDLLREIDRPGFAVHLDPVNMINCPARAYNTGNFLRECFAKLGPYIKACHAKDIVLRNDLTLHIDECLPGTGLLDYDVFLCELAKLDQNTVIGLEHLSNAEYPVAAHYIREVQRRNDLV